MTNKRFSDFEAYVEAPLSASIPFELDGEKNIRVSTSNFLQQIQKELLKNTTTDLLVPKYRFCENSGGIPINFPKHFLYMDGSTKYRTDSNILVAKFIDYIKDKPTLRAIFQVSNDNTSFILPDMRNQHLVGAGSNNAYGVYQTSKSVNVLSSVNTTCGSAGGHTHTPDLSTTSRTYNAGNPQRNRQNITLSANIFWNNPINTNTLPNDPVVYAETQSIVVQPAQGSPAQLQIQPYIRLELDRLLITTPSLTVVGTLGAAGDHIHTMNSTPIYNANLDNITRVPALALFCFLDINTDSFVLSAESEGQPLINIQDVIGLESALEDKLDVSEFDTYQVSNDAVVLDHETRIDTLETLRIPKFYARRLTGGTFTLAGNSTVDIITNLTIDPANNEKITKSGNALIEGVLDAGYNKGDIVIRLGFSSAAALGNTTLDIQVLRAVDLSATKGSGSISVSDADQRVENFVCETYIKTNTDPYILNGYIIRIRNTTNTTFTAQQVELLIKRTDYA